MREVIAVAGAREVNVTGGAIYEWYKVLATLSLEGIKLDAAGCGGGTVQLTPRP